METLGKYFITDCQLSSEEGRLRSADSRTCVIRRTYSNFVERYVSRLSTQTVEHPSSWSQKDIGY